MKIKEAVDVLIKHSICVKHMATCDKKCDKCTVSIKDGQLLLAYDVALDALAICSNSESYQNHVEKVS